MITIKNLKFVSDVILECKEKMVLFRKTIEPFHSDEYLATKKRLDEMLPEMDKAIEYVNDHVALVQLKGRAERHGQTPPIIFDLIELQKLRNPENPKNPDTK